MTFAGKIVELKQKLEKLGHIVSVPVDAETHSGDPASLTTWIATSNTASRTALC